MEKGALDEITVTGSTKGGRTSRRRNQPSTTCTARRFWRMKTRSHEELRGGSECGRKRGDNPFCAERRGEWLRKQMRACINAMAAIYVSGKAASLAEALVCWPEDSLLSGAALGKLEMLDRNYQPEPAE